MAEEWAIAVAKIRANDDDLKRTLKEDEVVVRRSVDTMQGDLNRLSVSTAGVHQEGLGLTQMFPVLSAQAAILGGRLGSTASQAISLTSAMGMLGKAAIGLPGLLMVAAGAIALLVKRFMDAKEAAKEARTEFERYTGVLQTREETLRKRIEVGKEQLMLAGAEKYGAAGVLRAQYMVEFERHNREMIALTRERLLLNSQLQDAETQADMERLLAIKLNLKANRERAEQINELRTAALEELNRKLDALEEEHRRKQIEADKAAAVERATAMREGFERSGFGQVAIALQRMIEQTELQQQVGSIVGLLERSGVSGGVLDMLRSQFGIAGKQPAMAPAAGGGHMVLSAFAASGRGPGGPIFGTRQEQREEKQTADISAMRKALEAILQVFRFNPDLLKPQRIGP